MFSTSTPDQCTSYHHPSTICEGFFQKQLDELHFGDGKFITHVGSDGKVAPSFEEIVIFN